MKAPVTRNQVAQLLLVLLAGEIRSAELDGALRGWEVEWPDSELLPADNFGVVDAAGELRFTVQVNEW